MISDLDVPGVRLWKYVDDITMSEDVHKNRPSQVQAAVDDLCKMSNLDKLQLNETKCKELGIGFSKAEREFSPITVSDIDLETVESIKLLGLHLSRNLKWNAHVTEIARIVVPRLYFLRQLRRSKVATKELVLFFTTCIRPLTEYACQMYHNSLPNYLRDDLERLQKRAMRIIFGDISYSESLERVQLPTLFNRRKELTTQYFEKIACNPNHRLYNILPEKNVNNYELRNNRTFVRPKFKTKRAQTSFINFYCTYT